MAEPKSPPPAPSTPAQTQQAKVQPASGPSPSASNAPGKILNQPDPWYAEVWKGAVKQAVAAGDELGEPQDPANTPTGGWQKVGAGLQMVVSSMAESRGGGGRGRAGLGRVGKKVGTPPAKGPADPPKTPPPNSTPPATASGPQPANGSNGGISLASGKAEDCGIKPYKDQKCAAGQQAHHIVPDYALRYGTRGEGAKGEKRIPGMPSLEDGPSICLSGGSKEKGSEHNKGHEGTDPRIKKEGQRKKNGQIGVAPIGDIIDISIEEVSKVKPHCADEIKKKTNEAFKGVDRTKYGRTTQMPPKAGTDAHGSLSTGARKPPKPKGRK